MLFTIITTVSCSRQHQLRFFFNKKTTTISTEIDESSFGNTFKNWLAGLLSKDPNKETQSNSFSKLAILKSFLLSSSSSTSNSKLNKLFDLLNISAMDDQNKKTSSSNKISRLLEFFGNQGSSSSSSSNNLQLALKLLNVAQGSGGLSTLNLSDVRSLLNFVSG